MRSGNDLKPLSVIERRCISRPLLVEPVERRARRPPARRPSWSCPRRGRAPRRRTSATATKRRSCGGPSSLSISYSTTSARRARRSWSSDLKSTGFSSASSTSPCERLDHRRARRGPSRTRGRRRRSPPRRRREDAVARRSARRRSGRSGRGGCAAAARARRGRARPARTPRARRLRAQLREPARAEVARSAGRCRWRPRGSGRRPPGRRAARRSRRGPRPTRSA